MLVIEVTGEDNDATMFGINFISANSLPLPWQWGDFHNSFVIFWL
jgi:hypothetical protein